MYIGINENLPILLVCCLLEKKRMYTYHWGKLDGINKDDSLQDLSHLVIRTVTGFFSISRLWLFPPIRVVVGWQDPGMVIWHKIHWISLIGGEKGGREGEREREREREREWVSEGGREKEREREREKDRLASFNSPCIVLYEHFLVQRSP